MKKLAILLIIPIIITLPFLLTIHKTTHAQTNVVAFLKVDQPDVELKRANTDLWVRINIETVIGVGDRIRTSGTGEATLTYLGEELGVKIYADTEIVINELVQNFDGYKVSIHVERGTTNQEVLIEDGSNSTYEFTTNSISVFMQQGSSDIIVDPDGPVAILSGDESIFVSSTSGVVEIPANHGARTGTDGALSTVLPVNSVAQLDTALDGLEATFTTAGDIQLNVRQGPSKDNTRLGTVLPEDLTKVHGISSDGNWYRIPFESAYGWVSSVGLDVATNNGALVVFADDYVEVVRTSESTVAEAPASAVEQGIVLETTQRLPEYLENYSDEELALIAGMNAWRMESGVAPLKPNQILTRMARDQANYLMSFPSIPNDLHRDGKGRYPRERAVSDDYRWPYYGQSARAAVGENGYVGNSVDAAVNWWKNSEIHRTAGLNAGYREIGVAAVPHPFGHLYIVVFGSRPNVFPVMYNPANAQTFMTTEQYQYSSGGDWLDSVQEIQQVPTVLTQLEDNGWQPFSNQMSLGSDQAYALAFRSSGKVVIVEVDPINSTVILPETLDTFLAEPEPEIEESNPTPEPPPGPLFPTNTPSP